MKKILVASAISVLAFSSLSQRAEAQINSFPQAGKLLYGLDFAYETDFGGNFTKTTAGGSTSLSGKSFSDVFDNPFTYKLGVSQGLSPETEIFSALSYSTAGGKSTNIGTSAGNAVNVKFGDYSSLEFSGGYRQYFSVSNFFRPYVSAEAGLKYVDKISASFSGLSGGNFTSDVFSTSYVPTFGIGLGAVVTNGTSYRLSLETGVKYNWKLNDNDSGALSAAGISSFNDSADRIIVPIAVKLDVDL